MTDPRAQHLVTIESLRALPAKTTLLHIVRTGADLASPNTKIAGAYAAVLERDFAGAGGGVQGRLPLPDPRDLTARIRSWGINACNIVVVYAARPEFTAAATRAWFVLRWAGLTDVRLLDGGLMAWQSAGGATEEAAVTPELCRLGTFEAVPGGLPTINADQAAQIAVCGTLLDAREKSAFDGHPDKPRSGHIPGAELVPSPVFEGGRLKTPEALRAILPAPSSYSGDAKKGVAAYCGAGVAATAIAFAYATLGVQIPVYVASWSGWSVDPARPIEQ